MIAKLEKMETDIGNQFERYLLYLMTLYIKRKDNKIIELTDRVFLGKVEPVCILLMRCYALQRLMQYDKLLHELDKIESLMRDLPSNAPPEIHGEYHNIIGLYELQRNEVEKAKFHFFEALKQKKASSDMFGLFYIYKNLAALFWKERKFNIALENLNMAYEFARQIGNPLLQGISQTLFGNIHFDMGNIETALNFFKKSLVLKEKVNIPLENVFTLNNLGTAYSRLGDLEKATECYSKAYKVLEELGLEAEMTVVLNNIGTAYHKRGILNEALRHYLKSLEIREKLGMNQTIPLSVHNIGVVYRDMGDFQKSKEYISRAYDLLQGKSDFLAMSNTLFELILLNLSENKIDAAKKYLSELEKIDMLHQNKMVSLRKELATALILKESKRIRDKVSAAEILKKIIRKEVINHDYTLFAMKNLFELLLLEYKLLREKEVENELRLLLESLYKTAHSQESSALLVETYALQAKLALITGNFEKSKTFLDNAISVIQENNISYQEEMIDQTFKFLKGEFEQWSLLVKNNLKAYHGIVNTLTKSQDRDGEILKNEVKRFNSLIALPLPLAEFKDILHPLKLTILKILYNSLKVQRSDLLKALGINSGTLEKHLKQLMKNEYISTGIEIIDAKPRTVIYLEEKGISAYERFKGTIREVIEK